VVFNNGTGDSIDGGRGGSGGLNMRRRRRAVCVLWWSRAKRRMPQRQCGLKCRIRSDDRTRLHRRDAVVSAHCSGGRRLTLKEFKE
jgi:hypothetical protein